MPHAGKPRLGRTALDLALPVPRYATGLYSAVMLALSVALLLQSARRGTAEISLWLLAYIGIAALSLRRPPLAPLCAGAAAFLFGFAKTHHPGFNLDLGASLVALSVAGYLFHRVRRGTRVVSVDLAGLALLSIATWSLVSLAFAVGRILAFEPAPGFGYHVYRFNTLGILSDAAIARATIVATTTLSWFGLYEWARTDAPTPKALNRVVFVILLANSAAMVVQRYVDPGFLLPAGPVPPGRLNGVTSFCYALGSAVIALYLLLPAWGARRGVSGFLTAGSLVFLIHAMVASGSRTSLGVMLAAALAWGVLWAVRFNRERRRGLAALSVAALVVLLSAAAAAYMVVAPGEETSLGRLKFWVEKQGLFGHLVATRLTSYPLAFRVMLEYPLSGVGVGLYMAEASKQHELLTPDLRIDPFLLTSYAPNQFLNTGVELGIPALVALVAAFAAVAVSAGRRGREASHLVVSVVVLAAALQLGPDLYNSEAVVFFCLILGLAARRSSTSAEAREPAPRAVGTRAATAVLGAIAVVAIAGHLLSLPLLSVDSQWKRLRWRMTAGMHPPESSGGRWSAPAATFCVDATSPGVVIRWHAGDLAARAYRAQGLLLR